MTAVLERPVTHASTATTLTDRRPPLGRLTALEVRKTLSTRSGRTMTAASAVLPTTLLAVVLATTNDAQTAEGVLAPLGAMVAVLVVAIGVLSSAGEWTHGTTQTTFLIVPQRSRIVLAKYLAAAGLGAAIAAVVTATSLALSALWPGLDFAWTGAGAGSLALIGAGAAFAVIGVGIGAAVTNAPAALTGSYAVLLAVLPVVRGIKPAVADKLDPVIGSAELIGGQGSTLRPILVLTGWVLVSTIAGLIVTTRRSVS